MDKNSGRQPPSSGVKLEIRRGDTLKEKKEMSSNSLWRRHGKGSRPPFPPVLRNSGLLCCDHCSTASRKNTQLKQKTPCKESSSNSRGPPSINSSSRTIGNNARKGRQDSLSAGGRRGEVERRGEENPEPVTKGEKTREEERFGDTSKYLTCPDKSPAR